MNVWKLQYDNNRTVVLAILLSRLIIIVHLAPKLREGGTSSSRKTRMHSATIFSSPARFHS